MNKKQKRNRGIVLTIKGWQKFQDARIERELRDNKGYKFTLEELGDRAGLTTATLRKILTRDCRVDKSSVVTLFAAVNLELDLDDYTSSKSIERPDNKRTLKKVDWGEAIDVSAFYGRTSELATLDKWLLQDSCRLIAIAGIGGIGKTALSVKLAEQVKDKYDYVIWRSLRDAPSIQDILNNLIQFLGGEQTAGAELPESTNEKISLLVECMRSSRCLIVLDNVESLFRDSSRAGVCDEEYEEYERLFQRVGESQHQSCLLLTTREKPKQVAVLEGENTPIRTLQLNGMKYKESEKILQAKGVSASKAELDKLITYYNGNALALKIVATTIRELFNGNVADFLRQNTAIFGDIRELLDEQFNRSIAIEKKMMYWLAINREPITLAQIEEDLVGSISQFELLEGIESLSRRCLIDRIEKNVMIEKAQVCFTLQSVVMEYVTSRLIDNVCREIKDCNLKLFRFHALMKATAKDYIKNSQIPLIIKPIINKLLVILKGQKNLENRLKKIIVTLQEKFPREPGYTAGNIINMLCQMETDLTGYDFSNLCIWQADLCQVRLHDVDFQNADLAKSIFVETFGGVLSVAFSPDGKILAMGDTNGEIRLRQVLDGKQILTLKGHEKWVTSLAFSPDGSMLASSSIDYIVNLWNINTGQCLQTLQEHNDEVWSVAFSPDGIMLASGSDDCTIILSNVTTGECLRIFRGHTSWVCSVIFSLDGQTLISGSDDHTIKFWNINTGEYLKTLRGHYDGIRSITLSPDGQTLASGSNDWTVKLWDISTGQCLKTFQGHSNEVYSVAFSPDSTRIASGSHDRTVKLWDISTGQCLKTFQGHFSWVFSVAFSPKNDLILSGSYDQTAKLWNIYNGQCLRTFQGYTNQLLSVTFSPDGQTLASGSHDCCVRLWNISTGQCLKIFQEHRSAIQSVTFSPDGQTLASGSHDCCVRLWNISTGQCLKTFQEHRSAVWSVAFSPDGRLLASSSDDRTVKLWDTSTGQCLKTFREHRSAVWSIAFSPDGQILASGSLDQTIKLYNVSLGKTIRILEGHKNWVWSVAFSPNGKLLASTSPDGTLRFWNINNGECERNLQEDAASLQSIVFSSDSQTLASCSHDYLVKLWNVTTGKCFRALQGHTSKVWSVAFSPNDKILASSGDDETIRLWDVKTGECLKILKAEKPYEQINIEGVTGLTEATIATLKVLGASDN